MAVSGAVHLADVDERQHRRQARLRSHPLLAGCSTHVLRRFAAASDEIVIAPGQVIVAQGHHGLWFFVIDRGRADVLRNGKPLAELGPGDHFGEIALLGAGLHPATVRARTEMTVFVISCQRFVPLVADSRRLRHTIEAALARQRPLVELARADAIRRRPRRSRPWRRAPARSEPVVPKLVDLRLPPRRRLRRRAVIRMLAWSAAAVAALALGAARYHPPLAVIGPGPSFDVSHDVTITGVPVHAPHGRYVLTSVRTERPTLLGMAVALLHGNRKVVPVDKVTPPHGVRATVQHRLQAEFRESRVVAAAAAAHAVGMPVTVTGSGARVTGLLGGVPGTSELAVGDVITAVDGHSVLSGPDVTSTIGARPPGTSFRLTVERNRATQPATTVSAVLADGRPGLAGVTLTTRDLRVTLPFEIRFRDRDIVGPSGGLVYALAIEDMLSPVDRTHGRTIAATGEIDPTGAVLPVGYLGEKAEAAARVGARVLFVPRDQAADVRGSGVVVVGVRSLAEALTDLAAAR